MLSDRSLSRAITKRWKPSATGTTNYATANNLNQYPSYSPGGIVPAPRPLGYDAKGNLTSGNLDGSASWGFTYDAENRLLTACKPYASGSCSAPIVNAAYAYDPLGRRNKKSGTRVTAGFFLNNGDDVVVEYDSGKNVVALYVPGPAIDEPITKSTPNADGTYAPEYFHS